MTPCGGLSGEGRKAGWSAQGHNPTAAELGTQTQGRALFLLYLNVLILPFQRHVGNSNKKCFSPEVSLAKGELDHVEHTRASMGWGLAETTITTHRGTVP